MDKVEDEEAKAEWDSLPQEKKDEWGFEYELQVGTHAHALKRPAVARNVL